ncbi:stage II sporulation protein R [uncultured Oscillibacter sp.]|uniref:stage II sporulation protein R n=1 Tax=uncultured Oscillibacter sp. TaxID=876091 RepID=UPI0025E17942|nr:stage II sporulation protein R [uncultured Oscillibacter sp.]
MKTMQRPARGRGRAAMILLAALVTGLLLTGVACLGTQAGLAQRVVRLHVLANSDSEEDQALKLLVRDAVLDQAETLLEGTGSRAEAESVLNQALPDLKNTAASVIDGAGYDYDVEVRLEETAFPTKEYDGFALPAGEYLALRVLIGQAQGQNWWCVVFPPLCTTASEEVPEAAEAAGLTAGQVRLITEEDGAYRLKFKAVELWEKLGTLWK